MAYKGGSFTYKTWLYRKTVAFIEKRDSEVLVFDKDFSETVYNSLLLLFQIIVGLHHSHNIQRVVYFTIAIIYNTPCVARQP